MRWMLVGLLLMALLAPVLAAVPAGGDVVLVHCVAHTVSGPVVPDATVVVHDGRIVSIASGSAGGGVDAHGMHLYPTLVDADTTLGLVEITEVRATHDDREIGPLNANLRADVAFNPDSMLLPVAMSSGILVAGIAPDGKLIDGRVAVMTLSGWTREDMTVKSPAALMVTWPSMAIDRSPDAKPPVKEQEKTVRDNLRDLREAFANARAYERARHAVGVPHPDQDVQWDAMRPFVQGELPVFVQADRLDQIEAALTWAQEDKVHMVLVGGTDAWRCADKLARAHVGVVYTRQMAIPGRDYESYDTGFSSAARLVKAGVPVALSSGGEAARVRDLRDLAGRAVAYGLSPDAALRSITLTPCELLGVSDRLGSLSPGKDATFFLADGDILDPGTHVMRAWIQGREVDLSKDRQKQLYEKYRNRPR